MKFRPSILGLIAGMLVAGTNLVAQPDTVRELAPGVFFHEGDFRRGHCNNGWIVLKSGVLVIDANFPSGAQVVLPKIKASTEKPIRHVLDTHHHGDHAYGNRLWADLGATIVAHTGAITEIEAGEPDGWNWAARSREDLRATTFERPELLFSRDLVFDDPERRVEIYWLGVAHTKGDAWVWLPRQKILFTGDACVNGAFNYMANANVGEWIKALEAARQLGATTVCPGHGAIGGPEMLVDQQQYFVELTRRVQGLRTANKSPAEVKAAVPAMIDELRTIANIARYVGGGLEGHAEKVWLELGGSAFPK